MDKIEVKEDVVSETKDDRKDFKGIVFHVKKFSVDTYTEYGHLIDEEKTLTRKAISSIIEDESIRLNSDIVLDNLKDKKDIVEYISAKFQSVFNRQFLVHTGITLAFTYDAISDTLYVGWAKKSEYDDRIQKRGYDIATKRADKISKGRECHDFVKIPTNVKKYIDQNLFRAKNYYKASSEKTKVVIFGE